MAAAQTMESDLNSVRAGKLVFRGARRAAFTLVELLMVIVIIGMLMSMLAVAIWRAYDYVLTAEQVMGIEQLHNAMSGYKESVGQYPPCLGDAVVADRKGRFMRHVQVAFSNSNYGVTEAHFNNMKTYLQTVNSLGNGAQPYQFRDSSGTVKLLDLNTLDQAEALVFWLAGFPTPCNSAGVPAAPTRTYGFNKDRDNPFRRDSAATEATDPLRFRTEPRMEFKQDRFADADNDGWLEYLPTRVVEGTQQAPYVYFDAPTYVASTTPPGATFNITNLLGYPRHQEAAAPGLAASWGLAVPMAEQYDAGGAVPMRWQNPQSFQIIAPGKDGMYSAGETGDLAAAMRFSVYPTGDTYTKAGSYKTKGPYSVAELDNLNNLGKTTLDGARQQAR